MINYVNKMKKIIKSVIKFILQKGLWIISLPIVIISVIVICLWWVLDKITYLLDQIAGFLTLVLEKINDLMWNKIPKL